MSGREPLPLSPRETEVATLLGTGLNHHEIGARLGIGVKTVDTHRGHVLSKLSLRNNSDITRHVLKAGWIDLDGKLLIEIPLAVTRSPAGGRPPATPRAARASARP